MFEAFKSPSQGGNTGSNPVGDAKSFSFSLFQIHLMSNMLYVDSCHRRYLKKFLTIQVLLLKIRESLQILFQGIILKPLRMPMAKLYLPKVGAEAGGPPYLGRGWWAVSHTTKKLTNR